MLCVRACVQARRQVTEREMGHAHDGIHTTSLVLIARTRTELTAHPRHIIIAARYGMRLLAISRQLIFRGGACAQQRATHRPRAGTHCCESRIFCTVRQGTVERDAVQTGEEARRFSTYDRAFKRVRRTYLLTSVQLPSDCRRLTCSRRLNGFKLEGARAYIFSRATRPHSEAVLMGYWYVGSRIPMT